MSRKGILLMDLLVAVGIITLVFLLAIPSFRLIRDYRFKQFLFRLEKLISTGRNASILRRRTLSLEVSKKDDFLALHEQELEGDNYAQFRLVSRERVPIPTGFRVGFSSARNLKGGIHNRLRFFPGGRTEEGYVVVRGLDETRIFTISPGDALKEVTK